MHRLLFEKTGRAVWISHLDLMRLFQRAFKRAGLKLTHTQGFNPRPSVSIALPLSVGVASDCELLDFDLTDQNCDLNDIAQRLNEALTEGVRVLDVYENGRKIRDLSLLACDIIFEYDGGVPDGAMEQIRALFNREALLVEKKTKSGIQDLDIIPMIRKLEINRLDADHVALNALICCQNPTLNPMQLTAAIDRYCPEFVPDFSRCKRLEIYDSDENVFR